MKIKILFALIAGSLLTWAFAPAEIFYLPLLSIAMLIYLWRNSSPSMAALLGLSYGVGFFGTGVSWIFISIHQYGQVNLWLALGITTLFVVFSASYFAALGYGLQHFFPHESQVKWLIIFPALWVIFEWLRSELLTGFPWLLLGYSQTNSSLQGLIPLVGVYGLSFVVVMLAAILIQYKRIYLKILILLGLSLLCIIHKNPGATIAWTQPMTPLLPVTLVQGNITQSLKWNADEAQDTLQLYQDLSLAHLTSRLIIWPETAIPLLWSSDVSAMLEPLIQQADTQQTAIITGVPIAKTVAGKIHYYNGVVLLGSGTGEYAKRHLVPFGEYIPFRLDKLLSLMKMPMSSFTAGAKQQALLIADGMKIAPFVCYEIAYTDLLQGDLPQANLLMTLSDDAWFNHSNALAQHLQMAQFAALASGRYMLVATNTGMTAIINPHGQIIAHAPIDQIATLTGEVRGMQGNTPWGKMGNTPIILLMFLLVFVSYLTQWKNNRINNFINNI